ncbi:MAG: heavy metal translocating P-type ATPase, partial [Gammaproteobacteria bacterium]|nr:heavy metal translocating P-type ATPase [Gammaproteobacteria bacterium]
MPDNLLNSDNKCCDHCQLPLPKNQTISSDINGETKSFCCYGCKTVCEMIYSSGMEGFYQRMSFQKEGNATLQPPPEITSDLEIYDLDEIQKDYISTYDDDKVIHLLIEGIHCAACVWLIEHRLSQVNGVVQANVNLSAKKLKLRWNDKLIKLSEILAILGQIGYAGVPFDPEAAEGQIKKSNRKLLLRLGFAGFAAMNLMWISIALYTGADEGKFKILFYWLGFALATPTLFYSGY